jgi:hypothetical protein
VTTTASVRLLCPAEPHESKPQKNPLKTSVRTIFVEVEKKILIIGFKSEKWPEIGLFCFLRINLDNLT